MAKSREESRCRVSTSTVSLDWTFTRTAPATTTPPLKGAYVDHEDLQRHHELCSHAPGREALPGRAGDALVCHLQRHRLGRPLSHHRNHLWPAPQRLQRGNMSPSRGRVVRRHGRVPKGRQQQGPHDLVSRYRPVRYHLLPPALLEPLRRPSGSETPRDLPPEPAPARAVLFR